jgi:hypothetical protein
MYFILSYMHDIIFKSINSLIYLLLNRKYLYNLIFDIIKKKYVVQYLTLILV